MKKHAHKFSLVVIVLGLFGLAIFLAAAVGYPMWAERGMSDLENFSLNLSQRVGKGPDHPRWVAFSGNAAFFGISFWAAFFGLVSFLATKEPALPYSTRFERSSRGQIEDEIFALRNKQPLFLKLYWWIGLSSFWLVLIFGFIASNNADSAFVDLAVFGLFIMAVIWLVPVTLVGWIISLIVKGFRMDSIRELERLIEPNRNSVMQRGFAAESTEPIIECENHPGQSPTGSCFSCDRLICVDCTMPEGRLEGERRSQWRMRQRQVCCKRCASIGW